MTKLKDILGEGINEMARKGNIFTLTQDEKNRINPNNFKEGTPKKVATWVKNQNGPIKNADIAAVLYPNIPSVNRGARTNTIFKRVIAVAKGEANPQPQRKATSIQRQKNQKQNASQRKAQQPVNQAPQNVVTQRPDDNELRNSIIDIMKKKGASQDEISKRVEFFDKVKND